MKTLSTSGASFIIYMAYKIYRSTASLELSNKNLPAFMDGVLLQILNPKAWAACLAGVSAFNTVGNFSELFLFITIYFVTCFVGISSWA